MNFSELSTIKKPIVIFLFFLIIWDVLTTYYGTISIFTYHSSLLDRLSNAPFVAHVVGVVFACSIITCIALTEKLWSGWKSTFWSKAVILTAFTYDFFTSVYGTKEAIPNFSGNIQQWLVVVFLSVLSTASPLLLQHAFDED